VNNVEISTMVGVVQYVDGVRHEVVKELRLTQ